MSRALVIVVVALVALVATEAVADPSPRDGHTVADKSPAVATAIAASTTAAGLASIYLAFRNDKANMTGAEGMLAYGGVLTMLIGPAAGHVYVGEKSKTRATMFVGRLIGGLLIVKHAINPDTANRYDLPLGATVFLGATLYDIFDAGRAARRHNARFDVKVAPGMYPTLAGSAAPAIAATGTF